MRGILLAWFGSTYQCREKQDKSIQSYSDSIVLYEHFPPDMSVLCQDDKALNGLISM